MYFSFSCTYYYELRNNNRIEEKERINLKIVYYYEVIKEKYI